MSMNLHDQAQVHSDGTLPQASRWLVFHKLGSTNNYKLVAEVQASSPEEVFRLTNHPAQSQPQPSARVGEANVESEVKRCWQANAGVIRVMPGPQRSTSIGDRVIQVKGERTWLLERQGFRLLGEGRRSRVRARGQADGRPKSK